MRTRLIRAVVSLLAPGALCGPASAQPVFFDDFDGPVLSPQWTVFPPGSLTYNLTGGMLNVTSVNLPNHPPKVPTNNGYIQATFPPLAADFVATTRMGWSAGGLPRRMEITMFNTQVAATILFGQSEGGATGALGVFAHGDGPTLHFPLPPPGLHDFVVARAGDQVSFNLDGAFLGASPFPSGAPVYLYQIQFITEVPNPGMAPFHVDRVEIVPCAGAEGIVAVVGLVAVTRRRR